MQCALEKTNTRTKLNEQTVCLSGSANNIGVGLKHEQLKFDFVKQNCSLHYKLVFPFSRVFSRHQRVMSRKLQCLWLLAAGDLDFHIGKVLLIHKAFNCLELIVRFCLCCFISFLIFIGSTRAAWI